MTINLATVNNILAQHKPALAEALRAHGVPDDALAHLVVHDASTGEVLSNTGPGGSLERAHAWVREKVTGVPYRDPGQINPMPPKASLRDPILKASHDAKVRGMLIYLLEFYRPDLAKHPRLKPAVDHIVASLARHRVTLAALPDTYARWDLIVESTIDWLEELPHVRPSKARG